MNPTLGFAYLERAGIYRKLRLDRYALDDLKSADQNGCRSPRLFSLRGQILCKSDCDAAIEAVNRAIASDALSAPSYALRARAWQLKGDWRRAIEDGARAIRLEPNNVEYHISQSSQLRALGDLDRSLEEAAAALGIERTNSRALELFAASPSPAQVTTVLHKLDSMVGELPADSGRALCLYRAPLRVVAGDYRGAIGDFETLAEIAPPAFTHCCVWLATLHGLIGDHDKAQQYLGRAAAGDPVYSRTNLSRHLFEPAAALDPPKNDDALVNEDVLEAYDIPRQFEHIAVPVLLGGKTFRFIVDTGATNSMFDTSIRSMLGPACGEVDVMTRAGRMRWSAHFSPALTLAGVEITPATRVPCIDVGSVQGRSRDNIAGILGMDVLQHFIIYLNCDLGKIAVLRRVPAGAGQPISLCHASEGGDIGLPWVELKLPENRTRHFLIDTGYPGPSLAMEDSLFGELSREKHIETLATSIGKGWMGHDRRSVGILRSTALSENVCKWVSVEQSTLNCIGLRYLFRHIVILDFPKNCMYMRPSLLANAPEAQVAARCWRRPRIGPLWRPELSQGHAEMVVEEGYSEFK